MSDLQFQHPEAIHWLWPILLVSGFLIWLELRGSKSFTKFMSATMQTRLVQRVSVGRRIMSIVFLGLALLAGVVALMRPQWGFEYRSMPQISAQIMVCLDVSRSMLAEDTKPNRLERSKAELVDLLSLLDNDQVGLTAFAGKATVLCPMTTDFSFLKLLIEDVGTHSVGVGGTKLAEPIRKAVNGFGEAADISRVILLITDGEDQDSYPRDAAEAAREKGIKIITIGFGDEAGSRIEFTDPTTGETDFIKDSNGQPVVSRLDGDLLRELALKTDGAYIPAGTGALDLESIYNEHISGLIRNRTEGTQQVVRNEAFQIPLCFSLVFLVAALILRSGIANASPFTEIAHASGKAVVPLLLVSIALYGTDVLAQGNDGDSVNETATSQDSALNTDSTNDGAAKSEIEDPRDIYNDAIAFLDSDLDKADSMLMESRANAGSDGEVRYRTAYNLGWVSAKRADKTIESEPQQALEDLQHAADWFSRAIKIRPKDDDARHNLEVVMRRALELSDSLAKTDNELPQQLDELIQQQRSMLTETGTLVDRIRASDEVDPDAQRYREDFRRLAVQQRLLAADAQHVLENTNRELDALSQKPEEERTDEEKIRLAQLAFATNYLQGGVQRMGQSRSQLRLRQEQRAYRRQAAALEELKRSRDAFRNPAERIQTLLTDSQSLYGQTVALSRKGSSVSLESNFIQQIPAWLTQELLSETQTSISDRTQEFATQLQSATNQEQTESNDTTTENQATEETDPEQLEKLREISGFVASASQEFVVANTALSSEKLTLATEHQEKAIQHLEDAAERLLDLRGLIEKTYGSELQIQQLMQLINIRPEQPSEDDTPSENVLDRKNIEAALRFAIEEQAKNQDRIDRIKVELRRQLLQLQTQVDQSQPDPNAPSANAPSANAPSANAPSANAAKPDPGEQARAERERLEAAAPIVEEIEKELDAATKHMMDLQSADTSAATESTESDIVIDDATLEQIEQVVLNLQELRRLFFTIIDRLKETAQMQVDTNDKTEFLRSQPPEENTKDIRGPIAQQQEQIKSKGIQIGKELIEQTQMPLQSEGIDPKQVEQQAQMLEKIREAAALVDSATKAMTPAIENLISEDVTRDTRDTAEAAIDTSTTESNEPIDDSGHVSTDQNTGDSKFDLDKTRGHQDIALRDLLMALQLLEPSKPNDSNGDSQQDQESNSNDSKDEEPEKNQTSQPQTLQALRGVRDREAERRREKSRKDAESARGNVNSDW